MMNENKQSGKGLAGFFVGLLLATAVIAGVLFFLNKSNKAAIKTASQPQVQEKTEILVPGSGSSISHPAASEASNVANSASQASDTVVTDDTVASAPTIASSTSTPADQLAGSDTGTAAVPPEHTGVIPSQVKTEQQLRAEQLKQQQMKRQAEADRLARQKKQQEEARKKREAQQRETAKPSPEQILDSGNVDKARQQANKEKAAQEAERKRAEAALSGRAGGQGNQSTDSAKTKSSGGKVVLQVGSYGNKQTADAQRAKLAMMGVSARVVEGQVEGKSVYRVQTGELSRDAAASVRKKLQQNGVQSLTRSVQ